MVCVHETISVKSLQATSAFCFVRAAHLQRASGCITLTVGEISASLTPALLHALSCTEPLSGSSFIVNDARCVAKFVSDKEENNG